METTYNDMRLTLDLGAKSSFHDDLQRIGIRPFDRATQDYVEPEAAARLTFPASSEVSPFIEVAYVGRHYFRDKDVLGRHRDMGGPEFIAGVELETISLSGQIAAIYAWRDLAKTGIARQSIGGPYVDLEWRANQNIKLIFAAASNLVQDSSGPVAAYPIHAAHAEAKLTLDETVMIRPSVGIKYENFSGPGGTLTVTPELLVEVSPNDRLTWVGSVGGEWSKSTGSARTFDASAKIGLRVNF